MTLVLVVDDEPLIRELIESVLVDEGYHVQVAGSGRGLLTLLETADPDLILMDVMMPDGNGRDTFRCLQGDCRLRSIPVVMMSAGITARALDPRIAGFLPKPFDLALLLAIVARTVGADRPEAS